MTLSYCIYVAVDCQWSSWKFEACSKACGGGRRTKSRTSSYRTLGYMPTGLQVTGLSKQLPEGEGGRTFFVSLRGNASDIKDIQLLQGCQ